MSFRRNNDRSRRWKSWVDQHRDELTAAGLPDWLYTDEIRWWSFLEEGGLDWETKFRVEMLLPVQAKVLHSLISREFPPSSYQCCLRALREVIRLHEQS